ncbi:MAG: hypothetical protein LBJ78_01660 [Puniceicoccales bacterium]|nr:hypothetical protein [Puniceicoccales bacterium]
MSSPINFQPRVPQQGEMPEAKGVEHPRGGPEVTSSGTSSLSHLNDLSSRSDTPSLTQIASQPSVTQQKSNAAERSLKSRLSSSKTLQFQTLNNLLPTRDILPLETPKTLNERHVSLP